MADTEAKPYPFIITSKNREYFFKMIPGKWKSENDKTICQRQPSGVAYKLNAQGEFEELWRTEGWYTFNGYLSDDGNYFIRMGPWAWDSQHHSDLAVAFYDRGKHLKSHRVCDLIRRPEFLTHSSSHYDWSQSEPIIDGTFRIETVDRLLYSFNYETGEIYLPKQLPPKNHSLKNTDQGKQLFDNGSYADAGYLKHFRFIDSQVVPTSCHYHLFGKGDYGATWSARIQPKQSIDIEYELLLETDVTIHLLEPIEFPYEKQILSAKIDPSRVLEVIRFACQHPYLVKPLRDNYSKLSLRISGDRFHWNSKEIEEDIETVTGKRPPKTTIKDWAHVVIENWEAYTVKSVFINLRSGDLIYQDESTEYGWVPVMIDKNGKTVKHTITPQPAARK